MAPRRLWAAGVIIDPQAGIHPEDLNARQTARRDVDTLLDNRRRFQLVLRGKLTCSLSHRDRPRLNIKLHSETAVQ